MSQHRKKNGIPDRWLDYRAVGKRIPGTRFIAFKVPLKQSLNRNLPQRDAFGHWELLDALKKENQELGLIIDLTFTRRYYQQQDVPDSLLFVKIFTAGHEIPSNKTILSFKRAVRNFLRNNADNDKLIGVHCTHGLNRTGYLICRYLIDVDGMDPKQAVKLFNSARGHDMERKNYVDDLQRGQKRSNAGMEESEQEPIKGLAEHRLSDSERREERRPQRHSDARTHRSFSPRDRDRDSHHRRRHDNGLFPLPPHFLPLPPPLLPPSFYPPYGRRPPPHPDSRRRPPRSDGGRSRFPEDDGGWRPSPRWQDDARRAPPPAPLPRYTPRWGDEPNGHDRHEEAPRSRQTFRQTHGGRRGVTYEDD